MTTIYKSKRVKPLIISIATIFVKTYSQNHGRKHEPIHTRGVLILTSRYPIRIEASNVYNGSTKGLTKIVHHEGNRNNSQ